MLNDGAIQVWRDLFDLYRQSYTMWPYASHQMFYNMLYKHFPEQRKYDREAVVDALTEAMSMCGQPLKVWELGGWDGALACEMIAACDGGIEHWHNVEICDEAVRHGWQSERGEYVATCPSRWAWESTFQMALRQYHIAVLSHVIEHLSWAHLQSLIRLLRHLPYLYIQTPPALGDAPHPARWMGTMSTHKLEVGWSAITPVLEEYGFSLCWHRNQSRLFARKA